MVNDDEIEQRLRQLREDETLIRLTKNVDLQKEIEQRLARLTNREPNFYSSTEPPVKILMPKRQFKTADEEADHLMDRFVNELKLDDSRSEFGHEVDLEIERRLKELKKADAAAIATKAAKELGKQKEKLSKHRQLIQQIIGTNVYDGSDEEDGSQTTTKKKDVQDEIDWCSTCNEDGAYRCVDCDNDIFCRECLKDIHRDSDMKGHSYVPYKKASK